MSELIELTDGEVELIGGGQPIAVNVINQMNFLIAPQVAIGVAVLSPGAHVSASNGLVGIQMNLANL